jgi:hypothetical protein
MDWGVFTQKLRGNADRRSQVQRTDQCRADGVRGRAPVRPCSRATACARADSSEGSDRPSRSQRAVRFIAPSRFGYLGTPMPVAATAEFKLTRTALLDHLGTIESSWRCAGSDVSHPVRAQSHDGSIWCGPH